MIDKERVINFNKYLIPIFLGIIAFLNSTFLNSVDIENNLVMNGLNLFTALILVSTMILLYASAPKNHIIIRIWNRIFKKRPYDLTKWSNKSNQLDIYLSLITWLILFTLLFISILQSFISFLHTI